MSSIYPIRSYLVLICPITGHLKEDVKKIIGEDVHQDFSFGKTLLTACNY